jgi:chaperonin cofactor prefoldin
MDQQNFSQFQTFVTTVSALTAQIAQLQAQIALNQSFQGELNSI